MSLQNFIPKVWAARIHRELEERYVFGNLVNRDYEGEISGYGDTVKINSVGDVTIGDYVKNSTNINPEELTSTQQELVIDQAKYFAFKVDDIDQAQTKPKVMSEAIRKSSRGLSRVTDDFLRDVMQNGAGLTDESGALSVTDIPAYMGKINQMLDEADNEEQGERFIVVPAWLKKLIVQSYQGNTSSEEVQSSGYVGRYYGINVYLSNRLNTVGADDDFGTEGDTVVIAGTREGTTLAEQIVKTEAYRPENSFADAVKGLHVYGARVVEPNALLKSAVSESTE